MTMNSGWWKVIFVIIIDLNSLSFGQLNGPDNNRPPDPTDPSRFFGPPITEARPTARVTRPPLTFTRLNSNTNGSRFDDLPWYLSTNATAPPLFANSATQTSPATGSTTTATTTVSPISTSTTTVVIPTTSTTTLGPSTTSTGTTGVTISTTSTTIVPSSTSTTTAPSTTTLLPTSTSTSTTSTTTLPPTTTTTVTTTTTTVDPCLSHCANGGTCALTSTGQPICQCRSGYLPPQCQQSLCDPNPCKNQGSCNITNNTYSCDCKPGYIGDKCEYIDHCHPSPKCQNGGTCQTLLPAEIAERQHHDSNALEFVCECPLGFIGNKCQFDDPCQGKQREMCLNQGNCTVPTAKEAAANAGWTDRLNYECHCDLGYHGVNCGYKNLCHLNQTTCDSKVFDCQTIEPSEQQLSVPLSEIVNMNHTCACKPEFATMCEPKPQGGSPASTAVAIVFALLFFACLGIIAFFAFRYVRRSRKLKGQYNPAKEEIENGSTPGTMQLEPMNKAERLI